MTRNVTMVTTDGLYHCAHVRCGKKHDGDNTLRPSEEARDLAELYECHGCGALYTADAVRELQDTAAVDDAHARGCGCLYWEATP